MEEDVGQHRLGARLGLLLGKAGRLLSGGGGGWIAVVNGSTGEVELFDRELKTHERLKAHRDGTGAVFVSEVGELWCVGWDGGVGRDGLAPSSLRRYVRKGKGGGGWKGEFGDSEVVVASLGRRRAATAVSVGFGWAVVGFADGDVVMVPLEVDGGMSTGKCKSLNGGRRTGGLGVEEKVLAVAVLAVGVAVVVSKRRVGLVRERKTESGLVLEEIDAVGCEDAGAACVVQGELVIAREDAISFYTPEGRGRCLAMAAPRAMTTATGPHLFVLSSGPRKTELAAYDVDAHLISYREENLAAGHVVGLFGVREGMVMVIHNDGHVQRLLEAPAERRVEDLLQRSLFNAAIAIARREADTELTERAVHLYARDLVSRGEYDAAAEQLAAIASEKGDTSWVLMLLAEQRGARTALIHYLEELLSRGLTNEKHIRLLVSCYNDNSLLSSVDAGVDGKVRAGGGRTERSMQRTVEPRCVPSDSLAVVMKNATVENTARVAEACRAAGLCDAAEMLVRQRGMPVLLAQILAEDREDWKGVLDLMSSSTVQRQQALQIAIAVGRWLRTVAPDRFVKEAINAAFRGAMPPPSTTPASSPSTVSPSRSKPRPPPAAAAAEKQRGADLSPEEVVRAVEELGDQVFLDAPQLHIRLLEESISRLGTWQTSPGAATKELGEGLKRLWNRLFEVSVVVDVDSDDGRGSGGREEKEGKTTAEKAVGQESSIKSMRLKSAVIGTRASQILQGTRSWTDARRVREVAELYGHGPCLRIVREQAHSYEALARQLRHEGDPRPLLMACRRHGDRSPGMWLELIRLAAEDSTTDGKTDYLEEAMAGALRGDTISALEVMDLVCSVAPTKPLSLVKSHFQRVISSLDSSTEADEAATDELRAEILSMEEESRRIEAGPTIVQLGTCQVCDATTTLPAVYFLCGHSFHARCLTANECSTCAAVTHSIAEVRKALNADRDNHDAFFRELERDGYDAVLRHLERSTLQ